MMKLNQKGAVALLTVVIFSIIITIVVTAYSRIAVVQQQESIKFDLSTRAYYAAEAGVQDAIRELRGPGKLKDDGRPDECGEDLTDTVVEVDSTSPDLAYTCQLIEVSPSDVVAKTDISKAVLFEVRPKNDPKAGVNYYIDVYWSKQQKDLSSPAELVPRNDYPSKLFPKRADWLGSGGAKVHPLMRTVFIRVNETTPLTRNSFKQNTFFLNPTTSKDAVPTLDFGASPQNRNTAILNTECVDSNKTLTDGDGYSCWRRIKIDYSEFIGKRVFIAFTSEYDTTDIKFGFKGDEGGTIGPLELKNSQAVIDVTAKAGSVFRRVQQRVPLSNNYSESDFSADALVAGDGICKHFIVTSNENDYKENCVVSAPPVE